MNYTVIWQPTAINELADIWIQAADRDGVTRAAHGFEQPLADDPVAAGEDRPDGSRVAYQLPLGVRYVIVEDDKKVIIGSVWAVRRRSG